MKKLVITTIILMAINAQAQKTWDFSDLTASMEAISNDPTNWKVDKVNSEGKVVQYHYVATVNDETTTTPILCGKENLDVTDGLLFSGVTSSKSFILSINSSKRHYFKINNSKVKIIIPNLKAGQILTITGKTGSPTEARGFTADNNLNIVSGFQASTDDNQKNVATVNANGNITIGVTAAMNIYSIVITGDGVHNSESVASLTTWDFTSLGSTISLIKNDEINWLAKTIDVEYQNVTTIGKTEQKPLVFSDGKSTKNLPITEGLLFSNIGPGKILFSAKSETSQYIKLNGSGISMIIPNAPKGAILTVELSTGKKGEARGMNVSENVTPTDGYFNQVWDDKMTNIGVVNTAGDILLTSSAGINIYKVILDTTTEIKNIEIVQTKKTAKTYNLAGQVVNKGYKGIVIQNGRKFIQK